jgi:hypothetical protein
MIRARCCGTIGACTERFPSRTIAPGRAASHAGGYEVIGVPEDLFSVGAVATLGA